MSEQLTVGELFAGYGGLGMAVEAAFDARLSWYAEFEDAPSKILAHHYPDLTNYGDVTAVDWATVPPVDIISGGSPCQDVSLAGRRAGMTEGTRSNLWGAMRTAIETIRPKYVVWENVRGALSARATSASDMEPETGLLGEGPGNNLRALGRVLGDLADLGYDTQWCGLRASDVGAPHQRFRVFILATRRTPADPDDDRRGDHGTRGRAAELATAARRGGTVQDTLRSRSGWRSTQPGPTGSDHASLGSGARGGRAGSATADTGSPALGEHAGGSPAQEAGAGCGDGPGDHRGERAATDWGPYAPAIHRWEQLRGPAPAPTEVTARGKHRLSPRFVEFMMGLPAGWVTSIDISRNDQLKALGNGVVPQQAAAALRHMLAAHAA